MRSEKNKQRHGSAWDIIKEGHWVVAIRDFDHDWEDDPDDDEPQMVWGMFGPQRADSRTAKSYDGVPFKVLAMSYPFLAVTEGKDRYSIDYRRFDLQIVSEKYAQAVHTLKAKDFQKAISSKKDQKKLEKIQKEEDEQTCKRCGTKMMSQRLIKPGSGEWAYYCPNCDGMGKGARRT